MSLQRINYFQELQKLEKYLSTNDFNSKMSQNRLEQHNQTWVKYALDSKDFLLSCFVVFLRNMSLLPWGFSKFIVKTSENSWLFLRFCTVCLCCRLEIYIWTKSCCFIVLCCNGTCISVFVHLPEHFNFHWGSLITYIIRLFAFTWILSLLQRALFIFSCIYFTIICLLQNDLFWSCMMHSVIFYTLLMHLQMGSGVTSGSLCGRGWDWPGCRGWSPSGPGGSHSRRTSGSPRASTCPEPAAWSGLGSSRCSRRSPSASPWTGGTRETHLAGDGPTGSKYQWIITKYNQLGHLKCNNSKNNVVSFAKSTIKSLAGTFSPKLHVPIRTKWWFSVRKKQQRVYISSLILIKCENCASSCSLQLFFSFISGCTVSHKLPSPQNLFLLSS